MYAQILKTYAHLYVSYHTNKAGRGISSPLPALFLSYAHFRNPEYKPGVMFSMDS